MKKEKLYIEFENLANLSPSKNPMATDPDD